jgi:hypothetical protein
MDIGWQDAVTLGLAAAAAIYLARRLRRMGRGERRTGCGACLDRPQPSQQGRLVQIDPPQKKP